MHRLTFSAIFILLAASCAAPDQINLRHYSGAPSQDLTAGQSQNTNTNCFELVNGQVSNAHPAVVHIVQVDRTTPGYANCTGTFIGPNTLVTAAHCVPANPHGDEVFYLPGNRHNDTEIENFLKQPDARNRSTKIFAANLNSVKKGYILMDEIYKDVAVVVFAQNIAPATISVAKTRPANGSSVVLVGFGNSTYQGNDVELIKRAGESKMVDNEFTRRYAGSSLSLFSNLNDGPSVASGDSGGPLLFNGELVGVASGYAVLDNRLRQLLQTQYEILSSYGDVLSNEMNSLLAQAKQAGAVIGPVTQPSTVQKPNQQANQPLASNCLH